MSKLGQTAPASTLDSALLELVDSYWTEFLDCAPDTLRRQTVQLVVHAALGDYAGCYLMEFGGAPIVSLPVHEVESYRAAVTRWHPGIVRMPELVEAVFGERVAATIGPAFVGYIDVAHFRPVSPGAARQIAHIAVVTHPGFRGHGYARTVVSTLTEIALGRTFVPQYRTLEANGPVDRGGTPLGLSPVCHEPGRPIYVAQYQRKLRRSVQYPRMIGSVLC